MASDPVIEPEALVDLGMGWASVNEQKGAPVWVNSAIFIARHDFRYIPTSRQFRSQSPLRICATSGH
jgi:hypothetical protein